ncbi:MAG TPA: hypothetical protein VMZ28_15685, partial [Kofleriaceae bacterium]|nr:hypothetical protein [Kofleriaceae bacterium]
MNEQRSTGREWLYLGLIVNAVVSLGWGLFFQYFLSKLNARSDDYEAHHALFAQLDMVSMVTAIAGLLASFAIVIGLGALIRDARGTARGLAQAAMVGVAITMAVDLLFLFFQLKGPEPVGSTASELMEWARYVNVFAWPGMVVCLALALHRTASDERVGMAPWVAGAAIAAAAAVGAVAARNAFGEPGERSDALSWISMAGSLLGWFACALLAQRLAAAGRGAGGWPRVARGLDLFGKALVARVALALVGTILVLFAAFGAKSISMVKVLTVLVPLTNFGCLVAMSAAAIRIASAPEPAAVRSVTTLAALLFLAAAALGTYVLVAS